MKYHLRRTLGSYIVTYEELSTLLAEIEACLNSRPLCTLFDDPFNQTYLSPGHFLISEPLTQFPSIDFTNVKCNRLSRWQFSTTPSTVLAETSSDYLQSLQQRQRWQRTSPNLQRRDLVLLKENNTSLLHWPTAVTTETHPGKTIVSVWSHLGFLRANLHFTLWMCIADDSSKVKGVNAVFIRISSTVNIQSDQ
jgi:hypothetical protein